MVFMDDIWVYSHSRGKKKHKDIRRLLLTQQDWLYVKFTEHEFWLDSVAFLEHFAFNDENIMDAKNIDTIQDSQDLLLLHRFVVSWV